MLGVSFIRHGIKDYVILTWKHEGKPALTIESAIPIDDAGKERVKKSIEVFLLELGFE